MMLPIILIGLTFLAIERAFPDQKKLPHVPGWWMRVILVNVIQAGMVVLAGFTWNNWLMKVSLFHLGHLNVHVQGAIGYLVATFVYYWWHRFRHESDFLWRMCHQFHHSPSRIETITSFYKHPVELFCNSIISAAASYTLLGLSIEGAAWVTLWSAIAEFFYHVNIATPRWLGLIIQRPEMHRIHHERGKHWNNFGDLPIWDMMFGTYSNPETYQGLCGFKLERELRVKDILLFRNVNEPYAAKKRAKLSFGRPKLRFGGAAVPAANTDSARA